jgi:hypothetical protein
MVRAILVSALTLVVWTPSLADPAPNVPRDYAKFRPTDADFASMGDDVYSTCMISANRMHVTTLAEARCYRALSSRLEPRIVVSYTSALPRVHPTQRGRFQRGQALWQTYGVATCDDIDGLPRTQLDKSFNMEFSLCQLRERYRRLLWLESYR